MAKRTTPPSIGHHSKPAHRHDKGRCLSILRKLSAYIDDELSSDICREIRRHLGACPRCEEFLRSLRQTVSLCRHAPAPALTSTDRARLREDILRSAGVR